MWHLPSLSRAPLALCPLVTSMLNGGDLRADFFRRRPKVAGTTIVIKGMESMMADHG